MLTYLSDIKKTTPHNQATPQTALTMPKGIAPQ
jgi:hypothetical protein